MYTLIASVLDFQRADLFRLLTLSVVFGTWAPSSPVYADEPCPIDGVYDEVTEVETGKGADTRIEWRDCWYAGLGLGLSQVDPEKVDRSGWSTDDRWSQGFELILGKRLSERWFVEFKYADLGEAGLGNENAAFDALLPDAAITYKVPSLMAGYYFLEPLERLKLYLKLGGAAINNKAVNSTDPVLGTNSVSFDEVTSIQVAGGVGAEYRFDNSEWFSRLNFDTYDKDAWFLSLSINRYFGIPRASKAPVEKVVSPKQIAPLVSASTPSSNDNLADTPSAKPIAKSAPPAPQIKSMLKKAEPAFEVAPPVPEPCEPLDLPAVLFDSSTTRLAEGAEDRLASVIESLQTHPQVHVLLSGHTDSNGSRQSNMALSKARVDFVMKRLELAGISLDRLVPEFYGAWQPVADNATEMGRRLNRRVSFLVVDKRDCAAHAAEKE